MRYFDTSTLLKLYTVPSESAAVQTFVRAKNKALWFTEQHQAESVSAMELKRLRGECDEAEAVGLLTPMDQDRAARVLRDAALDWSDAWARCRSLSAQYAASIRCRTFDALHAASALRLGCTEFFTTDQRQAKLANKLACGLR